VKVAFFRPKSRIKELDKFKQAGFEVLNAPLLDTVVNEREIRRFSRACFDVAIVTSMTAVEILKEFGAIEKLKGKRVIAIGSKTAEKLRSNGIDCDIPEKFDSRSIVKEFKDEFRGLKIALVRSDSGDPVLCEIGDTDEFCIYKIVKNKGKEQLKLVEKVCKGEVDFAVFSSRMMVRCFFEICKSLGFKGPKCRVIAIGPPTKKELRRFGVESFMPEEYTFDGILNLLKTIA